MKIDELVKEVAVLKVREILQRAGARGTVERAVAHRIQGKIEGKDVKVVCTDESGHVEMTPEDFVTSLQRDFPNAFSGCPAPAAASKPGSATVRADKVFSPAQWRDKVGRATATERRELLRQCGAGEILVTGEDKS